MKDYLFSLYLFIRPYLLISNYTYILIYFCLRNIIIHWCAWFFLVLTVIVSCWWYVMIGSIHNNSYTYSSRTSFYQNDSDYQRCLMIAGIWNFLLLIITLIILAWNYYFGSIVHIYYHHRSYNCFFPVYVIYTVFDLLFPQGHMGFWRECFCDA